MSDCQALHVFTTNIHPILFSATQAPTIYEIAIFSQTNVVQAQKTVVLSATQAKQISFHVQNLYEFFFSLFNAVRLIITYRHWTGS